MLLLQKLQADDICKVLMFMQRLVDQSAVSDNLADVCSSEVAAASEDGME